MKKRKKTRKNEMYNNNDVKVDNLERKKFIYMFVLHNFLLLKCLCF